MTDTDEYQINEHEEALYLTTRLVGFTTEYIKMKTKNSDGGEAKNLTANSPIYLFPRYFKLLELVQLLENDVERLDQLNDVFFRKRELSSIRIEEIVKAKEVISEISDMKFDG